MTRKFIDEVSPQQGFEGAGGVKALYPDMGVVAMLGNMWQDRNFAIEALSDRKPVADSDRLVVLAAPDPTCLDDVMRVVSEISPDVPVIMFNPRLASGDVGVGLNVRRVR